MSNISPLFTFLSTVISVMLGFVVSSYSEWRNRRYKAVQERAKLIIDTLLDLSDSITAVVQILNRLAEEIDRVDKLPKDKQLEQIEYRSKRQELLTKTASLHSELCTLWQDSMRASMTLSFIEVDNVVNLARTSLDMVNKICIALADPHADIEAMYSVIRECSDKLESLMLCILQEGRRVESRR